MTGRRHATSGLPWLVLLLTVLVMPARPAWATEHDDAWARLRDRSLEAVATLAAARPEPGGVSEVEGPSVVIVGFTGGLERRDSRVSGVVRMHRAITAHVGPTDDVLSMTYSNFKWRQAVSEVRRIVQERDDQRPRPLVIVYGHSWGAGAITKFGRALHADGIDIALAVYIDTFTLRQPKVPANVRFAVNLYQRTGILRGLPLRGKKTLRPDDPEATVILGSLRITPRTEHFGWNWNLVQPLLYRQHHRIGHDVRLREYLIDLVEQTRRSLAVRNPV